MILENFVERPPPRHYRHYGWIDEEVSSSFLYLISSPNIWKTIISYSYSYIWLPIVPSFLYSLVNVTNFFVITYEEIFPRYQS